MGTQELVDDLERLVRMESPSHDPAALRACAGVLDRLLVERVGPGGDVLDDGSLSWSSGTAPGDRPVLLLGHLDTVWPTGTIERLPFDRAGDIVRGPGSYDMKAGLVVAVHALGRLAEDNAMPAVRVLVTSDEEVGSLRSRGIIEAEARRCRRVLVLEPSGPRGAVKTSRKGVALGRLVAIGRASHAGLAPEAGVNAVVGLGSVLADVPRLGDDRNGTTVTPTLMRGGTTTNTVPARAEVAIDMRFLAAGEVDRVRQGLRALRPAGGAELDVELEENRPALRSEAAAPLLPALQDAARAAGQRLETAAVGGASDGNIAAAAGAAVLDGLGPEGGGAHADDEHVDVASMARRVDLLARLIPLVAQVDVP